MDNRHTKNLKLIQKKRATLARITVSSIVVFSRVNLRQNRPQTEKIARNDFATVFGVTW